MINISNISNIENIVQAWSPRQINEYQWYDVYKRRVALSTFLVSDEVSLKSYVLKCPFISRVHMTHKGCDNVANNNKEVVQILRVDNLLVKVPQVAQMR